MTKKGLQFAIKPFLISLICFVFTSSFALCQVYSAENELTLVVKGNQRNSYFYSTAVSSTLNMPSGEFVINGLFKTFTPNLDTSNKIQLEKLLDPIAYPGFTLRFNPANFSSLDRDTDNRQILQMNGNLLIGNSSFPISTNVEFFFMDKQLLFKLALNIKLQAQGISIPNI